MSDNLAYRLTGVAKPIDAADMLDQICEHFIEHADVERSGDLAVLTSKLGTAHLRLDGGRLRIDLAGSSATALQLARNSIAEHMFFFAGDDPLDLTWSESASPATLPNLHEVTVIGAEDISPRMRRVRFACSEVSPFIGGDMHVRLLVPPRGRPPVWPHYGADGRLVWPEGDDTLLVRAYTIREIDPVRREISIDFFQHAVPGVATPGSDFARDAKPGDRAAFVGPGSGSLPLAKEILLIGDESALPAIARIVAEVPAGTRLRAIVEVEDAREQQPLPSAGELDIRWLHRASYPTGAAGVLREAAREAIETGGLEAFVWIACEKQDVRSLRALLKRRGHDKKAMYVAWYWEKTA